MKRWFPFFALLSLLFIWAAGCGGDDLFGNQTIGGDASASDATSGGDATTGGDGSVSDGSVTDSGSDGSVTDGGEDSAVDSGEDAAIDSGFDAGVDAGPTFNVTAASSTGLTTMTVMFDALPNAAQAIDSANYVVTDGTTTLTLSAGSLDTGTNTVTFTTTTQTATTFTVTVSGVTRDPDGKPLTNDIAMFTGVAAFDVSTVTATSNTSVDVTFDAPPDPTSAGMFGNYTISGSLAVSGASYPGSGNTVRLTTAPQTGGTTYTVTVSGVTRASDTQALSNDHADFTGRSSFNVVSAVANSSTSVTVTFDATPNGQAATSTNYVIKDGSNNTVAVTAATPSGGATVTLTTAPQTAVGYTLTVSNVGRTGDNEALTTNSTTFSGIAPPTPFNVVSATSTSNTKVDVTFSDVPDTTTATTIGNYMIKGAGPAVTVSAAVLSATPNVVTLTTSAQFDTTYTLTVANVIRDSDHVALTNNSTTFAGTTAAGSPTVTNVVVASTLPDNGTIPYNTGTSTVTITGTNFTGATCPTGIALDDLDGAGTAVGTHPNAVGCSVDSDTQITATFPAGIRTNGATGWNVIVNNAVSQNVTSSVKFVPVAGLLISEVLIAGSSASHEFFQIYNPTANDIAIGPLGLSIHIRNGGSSSTVTDNVVTLSGPLRTNSASVPHGGVMLFVSSVASGDAFAAKADYTYTVSGSGLVADGGLYLSLSATKQAQVLDKVGWGNQVAGGFEGTAISPSIPSNDFVERKPGAGNNSTDTDVNNADFNAAVVLGSTVPLGTTP